MSVVFKSSAMALIAVVLLALKQAPEKLITIAALGVAALIALVVFELTSKR